MSDATGRRIEIKVDGLRVVVDVPERLDDDLVGLADQIMLGILRWRPLPTDTATLTTIHGDDRVDAVRVFSTPETEQIIDDRGELRLDVVADDGVYCDGCKTPIQKGDIAVSGIQSCCGGGCQRTLCRGCCRWVGELARAFEEANFDDARRFGGQP